LLQGELGMGSKSVEYFLTLKGVTKV